MEFEMVTSQTNTYYITHIKNEDSSICVTEKSLNKKRAKQLALDRLYIKLVCRGIDTNSVTIKKNK